MVTGYAFRRALLGGALAAMSGPAPAQPATAQMTQAEAQYEPRPHGIAMCASCTLFVRPNLCRQVAGEVSAEGWCKLFDMVD
jgi:hypothetical protein